MMCVTFSYRKPTLAYAYFLIILINKFKDFPETLDTIRLTLDT